MKTTLFLSALWLTLAGFFAPGDPSYLTGKVTDENGDPLIGAAVKILQNNTLVKGVTTDMDGKYKASVDPGTYTIEMAYTGFESVRFTEVIIQPGKTHILDGRLSSGGALSEVVITTYKVPLIEQDKTSGGQVITSDQIKGVSKREGVERKSTKEKARSAEKSAPKTSALAKTKAKSGTDTPPPPPPPPPAKGDGAMGVAPSTAPVVYAPAGEAMPKPSTPASEEPVEDIVIVDGKKMVRVYTFDPETYEEAAAYVEVGDGDVVDYKTEESESAPEPGIIAQPRPRAGLLTAGEWNDLHNWNRHWVDLLSDGEITAFEDMYAFYARQRYTVMLTNDQDFPLADVVVHLKNGSEILWEARTDNTGKAELWAGLYDKKEYNNLSIDVLVNGKKRSINNPKVAKDGFNFLKVNAECFAPTNVDIVWAVDATGSMGDEIEYLKTEVLDVISRAKNNNPVLSFRMGTAFYRDKGDEYIVKSSGLSSDINETVNFIQQQFAGGGGDYPEAVHSALEDVVYNQKWSEKAIARICFLVLDASPHQNPEVIASLQRSIKEAARRGIRIVPITASGIQKDTEFLMKFFGLATNGSYVFLTDHSGIGGKHLEPTTDEYKVEPLNELLVRIITEYTSIETCEGKSNIRFENDPQQQPGQPLQATYYPNPAVDQFTLELPFEVQSVTLYDSEGKGVRKLEKPQAGANVIPINDLAPGFYTIRILNNGRMQSGKLMVVRS